MREEPFSFSSSGFSVGIPVGARVGPKGGGIGDGVLKSKLACIHVVNGMVAQNNFNAMLVQRHVLTQNTVPLALPPKDLWTLHHWARTRHKTLLSTWKSPETHSSVGSLIIYSSDNKLSRQSTACLCLKSAALFWKAMLAKHTKIGDLKSYKQHTYTAYRLITHYKGVITSSASRPWKPDPI